MSTAVISKPTVPPPPGLTAEGVELFIAGLRRDNNGNERLWTQAELDEAAAAYNSTVGQHDAPALLAGVQIGHDGNKAYGWLARAYREGDRLLGDYRDVDAGFAEQVNAGRYRKRSVSFYPPAHPDNPTPGKWNIRHVAYVPIPAVKGMKDHTFGRPDDGCVEYGEDYRPNCMMVLSELLSMQRDAVIEAEGVEYADRIYPKYMLEMLRGAAESETQYIDRREFGEVMEKITELREWVLKQFADPSMNLANSSMNLYQENPDMITAQTTAPTTPETAPQTPVASTPEVNYQEQIDALRAELTQAQETNKALAAMLEGQQRNAELERVTNFVEGLVQSHRVRPVDKADKIKMALALSNTVEVEFGEGDNAVKKTVRQRYLDELAGGPVLWKSDDLPTGAADGPSYSGGGYSYGEGYDAESVKMDRKIRAKCKEMGKDPDKAEDYAEAMRALGLY